MNKRGFLGALAAALTFDPEKALWVPGAKTISIPAPQKPEIFMWAEWQLRISDEAGFNVGWRQLAQISPWELTPDQRRTVRLIKSEWS